jgi:hypothetical protein
VFEKYSRDKFYWELIILLRKVLIVVTVLSFGENTELSIVLQLVLCFLVLCCTVKSLPYLTDEELLDIFSGVEMGVERKPKKKVDCCCEGFVVEYWGTNNLLDIALSLAEIFILTAGLVNKVLIEDLLSRAEADSKLVAVSNISKSKYDMAKEKIETEWPALSIFLAILLWAAVSVIVSAIFLLLQDIAHAGYMYVTRDKRRERLRILKHKQRKRFRAEKRKERAAKKKRKEERKRKREEKKRRKEAKKRKAKTEQKKMVQVVPIDTTRLASSDEEVVPIDITRLPSPDEEL